MKIYPASACGNTFLIVDCLNDREVTDPVFRWVHKELVDTQRDDAMILFDGRENNDTIFVKMLLYGQDAKFGEFCGNGARASAAFLTEKYPGKIIFLQSEKGAFELKKIATGIYSVRLPIPNKQDKTKFIGDLQAFTRKYKDLHFVDMVEPHLVTLKNLSEEELLNLGRQLNQDSVLFPYGININACQKLSNGRLRVKTYERGVQRLTRSCGTGSMSSAYYFFGQGKVSVETPGGVLQILIHEKEIELVGPAKLDHL